ncbi:phage tail protein [Cystobacter fuscus]|uniref:Phage tail protein n=1 Tax=Cystobacter fuscus TaxID=43 RepID=A0A250J6C9_9BACT|nr:phage baseplate assembly protein V [Cystobacter fuscus]ATB39032.1 phage tail protein [Cystobacter fuscus]
MTDELLVQLTRQVREKYYGKYRGFVVDNEDPEKLGRLRVMVPSVLGEEPSPWALPCMPFGGLAGQGWFLLPEVDAQVWVEFEEGDVRRPIWTGTFWQKSADVPEPAAKTPPTTRLLQTPGGHVLQFDDEPDQERLLLHHPSGAEVSLEPKGSIALTDAEGATVVLDAEAKTLRIEDSHGNSVQLGSSGVLVEDANGNRIELGSSGATVSAQKVVVEASQVMLGGSGGEPVIKGQSFLSLFATHMHTSGPPGGPTSPPIPQGEMSTLSMKVTTS